MWTIATREKYNRSGLRYQSDVTDEEWGVIEPLLPKPKARGRPWGWPVREIVNAIFYVMRSGCPWRLLPGDLPSWSTVYRWFVAWRGATPMAGVIDSQSVKTTEAGGPRGYDAGKKVNGCKRHALVDTDGRALLIEPHPASVQDRDGGGPLLRASRALYPCIERVFADSAYDHERVQAATSIVVEIVHKIADQVGFVVLPRRWVVERFFAWINRNRLLAKDFEATIDSARAFLYAASINCSCDALLAKPNYETDSEG